MKPLKLRRPTDQLAGCLWLPRLADKTRAHLAGELPPDFEVAFCYPRAMDGFFLQHFGLDKAALLEAIPAAPDDAAVVAWFTALPGVDASRIAAWNELAPNVGREGYPGHRELRFMLRRIMGLNPEVVLNSSFEAIAWDERDAAA